MPRVPPIACLLAMALLLSSCGAGLITGVVTGSRGNNTPEVRAPEISLTPLLPLVPAPETTRTIVVANAQLVAAARLRVRIDAAGVGIDQPGITAAGQGGSTAITFQLDTAAIRAAVGNLTSADVPGELRVLVDDNPIAEAVPIVLARQPRATLLLEGGAGERLLSPFGERVRIRVDGLRSSAVSDLQVVVVTPDPAAAGTVLRLGADLRLEPSDGGAPIVSATLPGSTFPTQIELSVRDAVAGQSTTIANAFYRPEVALALPSQGPTTGGTLLTLIGAALVPRDFRGTQPAPFAFAKIELSFEKGGRVTELAAADFRVAESGSDRLVFTMPPSPDGRPGQVNIVLRVDLGPVVARVVASQVFLFANPDPFFGPRGTVLERLPVAVAPIALDSAPSTTAAPDFAALTDPGGVAFLQLLLAQQNGMFQRFAAPRQIGDPEVAAERLPRDLCVADFDGDQIPDVFIANEGAAAAVHHLVLGQARPLAPLGAVHRIAAAPGTWKCFAARFDGDALPDLLLIPGPAAPVTLRPQVLLARPLAPGQPAFAAAIEVPVRNFPYEAFEVADLDGDGMLDIAVVSGTSSKLDVAWGHGDGTFAPGAPLDFVVPGYTPDPQSPAVGLHACRDGAQQSLGLVLSGLLGSFGGGPTQPTVAVLSQASRRSYGPIEPAATVPLPTEPIGRSLAADLDAAGPIELVVAMRDEPLVVSLGLLQFEAGRFLPIAGSIEGGIVSSAESPRQIRALVYDRAFPDANAVFLVHETEVDGSRERRLSTRLVKLPAPGQPQPLLLPPDAGAQLAFTIRNLVGGNFHPVSVAGLGAVRDLALVQTANGVLPDAIVLVANDGFGGFPRLGNRLEAIGLLAEAVTLLPAPAGVVDRLLYATRDSRLSVWRHDPTGAALQLSDASTSPLRALSQDPLLAASNLADATRLRIGDVDGDGIDDVVVLLSFGLPGEGQAALALLRGKGSFDVGEFPFFLPTSLTPVHGNASALVLGDFVVNGTGQARRLEVAVAVPGGTNSGGLDGDHVRFYRYLAGGSPAEDRLVPAAAASGPQVLLAGSKPTELAATDFDRDGTIDLLVACRGDSTLRLFRNTAAIDALAVAVDVGAFHEGLGSPRLLAGGTPTRLLLADVNGDGNRDAMALVEFTSAVNGSRSTTIATYLSSGGGEFDGPRFLSPSRIGNRNAHLSGDVGDWNRDGVVDLFLGWGTSGGGDINLRVLFGGTR